MNTSNISVIYDKSNKYANQIVDNIYQHFCYDISDIMAVNLGYEIHLYNVFINKREIESINKNNCCLCVIIITDSFFHDASATQNMVDKLKDKHINTLLISLSNNKNLFIDLNLLMVDVNNLEKNLSRIMCVLAQKLCNRKVTIFLSYFRAEGDKYCKEFKNRTLNLPGFAEFLDIKDIEIGSNIQQEIESCIKDNMMLCIYTPKYSERFWGMVELLIAKKNNVPIVIADCLDGVEKRRNPNSGNVPVIRFNYPINDEIVSDTVLLLMKEYLRKCIFHQESNQQKSVLYLWKSPELSDLAKAKKANLSSVVYPAPPICRCEVEYYNELFDIDFILDNNISQNNSKITKKIVLSYAEGNAREHTHPHFLKSITAEILRYLIYGNYTISYGGDWRKNGFTQQIINFIDIYRSRHQGNTAFLNNYFVNLCGDDISHIEQEIFSYGKIILIPYEDNACKALTNMRLQLISDSDAVIVLGGHLTSNNGITSGIAEEVALAIINNKPLYLIGASGGATKTIVDIMNGMSYEFTSRYFDTDCQEQLHIINNTISNITIEDISKNNGLSLNENLVLFNSQNINLLLSTLFRGIERI